MSRPSILLLAERGGGTQAALQKASIIARHFSARLELFACDVEHGWALRKDIGDTAARDTLDACLTANSRYLQALRVSLAAPDLEVGSSVACAGSVWEGVAACVDSLAPLLLVHGLEDEGQREHPPALRAELMQLLRHATAPVLLTRGRSWAPAPRIVVAPQFGAPDRGTRAAVLDLAQRFHAQCHGWLIEAGSDTDSAPQTLGNFAARVAADILVVAAAHEGSWTEARGSDLEVLLGDARCDVLVVPRGAARGSSGVAGAGVRATEVALRSNPPHGQPEKS